MATKKTTKVTKSKAQAKPVESPVKELNKVEYSLLLNDALTWRDEKIDKDHVAEIRKAVKAMETPPVVVARFPENGEVIDILVDGVHRTSAAVENKQPILKGRLILVNNRDEARAQAFALNNHRVLNLTASERKTALLALLQLDLFKKKSNKALGELWKVSDMTIKRYRDILSQTSPNVSQSGHKNKAKGTPSPATKETRKAAGGSGSTSTPKEPTEPVVDAKTTNGLPIEIRCAAQLCGGGESLANAIIHKLTAGHDESDIEYLNGVLVMRSLVERLVSFIEGFDQAHEDDDAADRAIDEAIEAAKAKAAAKKAKAAKK